MSVHSDLLSIASNGLAIGLGDFRTGNIDIQSTYDPRWQQEYHANDWLQIDPVVTHGVQQLGTYAWPTIPACDSEFGQAAHDFGITRGWIVSQCIGGNQCIAGLSIQKPLTVTAIKQAEHLVREMHLDYLTQKAHSLSDSQKDLVYLFANGYRAKNAAEVFGISEEAVKQRKVIIQKHLGVNSFMVVVNICARAGLNFHPIS